MIKAAFAKAGEHRVDRPQDTGRESEQAWALWRAVVREFGMARTLSAFATSPVLWGYYGVDFASRVRRERSTRRVRDLVANTPDCVFEALTAIAAVNQQRNDGTWRIFLLVYVTIPTTLLLGLLEIGGARLVQVLPRLGLTFWIPLALAAVWLLYYFITNWRSRKIVSVLEIVRVERMLAQQPGRVVGEVGQDA